MNKISMQEEKIRIMVVEDNLPVAESIKNYLALENFDVVIYREASEALTALEEANYHLILLDLRLPRMSGQKMLKKMRQRGWTIPVIIITAYPSLESAIETFKLRASDYIKKPFTMSHLLRAINIVIEERGITARKKRRVTADHEEILISKVGKKIKSLRHKKKLTLEQLAKEAGISPILLSKIETGSGSPSLSAVLRIAKSLQTSLKYFFEDIEV